MAPLLPPVHSPTRPRHSSTNHSSESQTRPRSASQRQHSRKTSMADKQKFQVPALPAAVPKPKIVVSEKDLQAALNRIDNMDLSEPEDTGFEEKRIAYTQRQHKRRRGNEDLEAQKRKVGIYPTLCFAQRLTSTIAPTPGPGSKACHDIRQSSCPCQRGLSACQ